jgi:hypothetical protein
MVENKLNVNVLKGRLLLETPQGVIEVHPFENAKNHLIKYMGYYDTSKYKDSLVAKDPYIYIYRGKLKAGDIKVPGSIYKLKDGKLLWLDHDPDLQEEYHLSKCKTISKEIIEKVLDDPKTKIKEVTPELLDAGDGDVFMPQIRDNDDLLKRVVKTTLQQMHLNIKTLRSKFDNDYDLNNLKSQLVKEGAMSWKYFKRWTEILGIKVEVIVTNQPGSNKLPDEVTIVMK